MLVLAACAGRLPEADAALATSSGVALDRLQAGRRIYVESCTGCHRLHRPTELTEAAWRETMVVMARKAHLEREQADTALAYLLAAGRR